MAAVGEQQQLQHATMADTSARNAWTSLPCFSAATNRPSRGQKIKKTEKNKLAYPKNTIRLNRCKYQR
jgi:hypothetical protein